MDVHYDLPRSAYEKDIEEVESVKKKMIDSLAEVEFDNVDDYVASLNLDEDEAQNLKRCLLIENKMFGRI